MRQSARIPVVGLALMKVIHLVKPPLSLFAPGILGRAMLPWI